MASIHRAKKQDADGRAGCAGPVRARGFTYIAVLIFIAVMGVGLAATGEVWHQELKREREAELLFAGDQFRNAIALYYAHAPSPAGRYPTSLDDLLKDPRYPATRRYIRKIYPDPIGGAEWKLVKGPNGEIVGVYSASEDEPVKKGNFSLADQAFEGKTKYSDWVFVPSPKTLTSLDGGRPPAFQSPGAQSPAGAQLPGASPPAALAPAAPMQGSTR